MNDIPLWTKNTPDTEPIDGEQYIIAVKVMNTKTGKEFWQLDQVTVTFYDDGMTLYQGDDAYTDWEWEDVDFFIKCES